MIEIITFSLKSTNDQIHTACLHNTLRRKLNEVAIGLGPPGMKESLSGSWSPRLGQGVTFRKWNRPQSFRQHIGENEEGNEK